MDAEREKDGGINEGMAILRLPLAWTFYVFIEDEYGEQDRSRSIFDVAFTWSYRWISKEFVDILKV